jgi:hypothetical protein
MNKKWHQENRLPRNAKLEERIEWHLEHESNCGCRPVPGELKKEAKARRKRQMTPPAK